MRIARVGWISIIAVGIAGCGAGSASPPANTPQAATGTAALATASGVTLQLWTVSPAGLVAGDRVTAPAQIDELGWHAGEPIVLLGDQSDPTTVGVHHGEIGRITHGTYEPLPPLPAATWAVEAKPTSDSLEAFAVPEFHVVVAGDAIWEGRCQWGYHEDGGACTEWMWARVAPTQSPATATAPPFAPDREPPPLEPSPHVQLATFEVPRDDGSAGDTMKMLRCTADGKTTEYPNDDRKTYSLGVKEVIWLGTDPAMYQVIETVAGLDVHDDSTIFEGCAPSPVFKDARLAYGPDGLFAIYTSEAMSVRWHGREIGRAKDTPIVAFAQPAQ